jgi:hypothetical protein
MNARRICALASCLLLCLVIAVSEVERPLSSTGATPTAAEAAEIALRTQFGLSTDIAHIREVDASSGADVATLGIPLSAAEAANIKARDGLGTIAADVTAAGMSLPSFGGVWIDQQAGGTLRVGVRGAQMSPVLGALIPTSVQYTTYAAQYSYAELVATAQDLTDATVQHDPLLATLVKSAVDVKANRVSVVLLKTTTTAVVDAILARFGGDQLIVTYVDTPFTEQVSRNETTGPVNGGAWISSGGPVNSGNCTAGFSRFRNRAGIYFTVTAGHCDGGTWYEGRNRVGDRIGNGYANGWSVGGTSNCDCVAIGSLTPDHVSNYVLVDNNGLFRYSYTGGTGQFQTGQRACLSGAQYADAHNEAIKCGQIVDGTATVTSANQFTLTDAATVNFTSLAGDSGGPYGNGGYFLGIHNASNFSLNEGALTKAYNMAARFGGQFVY